MAETSESPQLVVGKKIEWLGRPGSVGEVSHLLEDNQLEARFPVGLANWETVTMPRAQARIARLHSQQRVGIAQDDHWLMGRLVTEIVGIQASGLRVYFVAFPDQDKRQLAEDQFHVFTEGLDPLEMLQVRALETPRFFDYRTRFVKTLARHQGFCGGLSGLLSARVELWPHQIATARNLLNSPRLRHILADERGLGKRLTAALVARQVLLDDPGTRLVVVAPGARHATWRDCLFGHAALGAESGESARARLVLPEALADTLRQPPENLLLVIDHAESVVAKPESSVPLHAQAPHLAGLLFLTQGPLSGHETEYLTLCSLIDASAHYDTAQLKHRLEVRHQVGRDLFTLERDETADPAARVAARLHAAFQHGGPELPADQAAAEFCQQFLELHDQRVDDAWEAFGQLKRHLRQKYRLHPRLSRMTRRDVEEILPRRQPPRLEYELDSERKTAIWQAFSAWREHVSQTCRAEDSSPATSGVVAIFRELAQSIASWSGWADKLLRARLGVKGAPDPAKVADSASVQAMLAVPLLAGERPHLEQLRRELEADEGSDRVQLLVELFKLMAKRQPKLPRVVIVTRYAATAQEIDKRLRRAPALAPVLFHAGMTDAQLAEQYDTWREATENTIVVADDAVLARVSLAGFEQLIHFDLPYPLEWLERRYSLVERLGKSPSAPVTLAVLTDSQGHGYDEAWYEVLHEGLAIFDDSPADQLEWINQQLAELERLGLLEGISAWRSAVPVLRESLRVRRADQAAQDLFDAPVWTDAPAEATFFDSLRGADREAGVFAEAVQGYLYDVNNIDVKRLQRLSFAEKRGYHDRFNVLMPENWYKEIEVDLWKPGCFEREKSLQVPRPELLRPGHPLVESLARFAMRDDRGKAFVLWRQEPSYKGAAVFFRFLFVVSIHQARLLEQMRGLGLPTATARGWCRTLVGLFPTAVHDLCLNEAREVVKNGKLLAALERPYEKSKGDRSLGKDRAAVVEPFVSRQRWPHLCAEAFTSARAALEQQLAAAEPRQRALETLRGVLQNDRDTAPWPSVLTDAPEAAALLQLLHDAALQPALSLDAAGVILLSAKSCPVAS